MIRQRGVARAVGSLTIVVGLVHLVTTAWTGNGLGADVSWFVVGSGVAVILMGALTLHSASA